MRLREVERVKTFPTYTTRSLGPDETPLRVDCHVGLRHGGANLPHQNEPTGSIVAILARVYEQIRVLVRHHKVMLGLKVLCHCDKLPESNGLGDLFIQLLWFPYS
jgi:hypothetical protein